MPPFGRQAVEVAARWPAGPTEAAIEEWELKWVTRVALPEPLPLDWDHRHYRTTLKVHKIAAQPLRLALSQIHSSGLWPTLVDFSGDQDVRKVRGGAGLSMHSYGLAVDFNASQNALGAPLSATIFGGTQEGRRVVEILESWGWAWGGRFPRLDSMHFQWARGC